MSDEQKNGKGKSSAFWLCVCMAAILISCIGASVLQTNFGATRIQDLYIGTDHQQTVHALMFIPKNAAADHKLPAVITCHGGMNSGEMQDAAAIELSRRGVVVIAMDAYNHGMSSAVINEHNFFAQERSDALGMIAMVEYVTSGILDYVDTSRIGVMGHSLGSHQSENTIMYYGKLYNAAIEKAKRPDSPGGAEITPEEQAYANSVNKVFAAFPTGNPPIAKPETWASIYCNVGYLYSTYDENGYRTSTKSPIIAPVSDEALTMMNSVQPAGAKLSSVELGKYYGNKENRTLRVLYQPAMIHPWIHFSTRATANVIEFFTRVFDLNTSLSQQNQIWNLKQFFNFIGLVAIFVLLVPMAKLLMRIPCFASLSGKEPPRLPALTPLRKAFFWGGILVLGLVSFFTGILSPIVSNTIMGIGPTVPRRIFLGAFENNPIMIWAIINGIIAITAFWLIHKKVNSKNGVTEEMIGWKIDLKSLLKTFALAVTIVSLVYAIVALARWAFVTDFRLWTPALKTYRPDKLLPIIGYTPFFFLFYLGNSLLVNGAMRVEGMKEKQNILICGIAMIWGVVLLLAVQYGTAFFRADHTIMWPATWTSIFAMLFCIPQVFVATYLARYFFKATGKVWLGAMVNTILMVSMTMANTILFGVFV